MTADAQAHSPQVRRDTLSGWKEVTVASWRWLLRPDVAERLQRHPALNFDDLSQIAKTVIKQGPQRTVHRIDIGGSEFYLKQFHHPDLKTHLRHLLRGSQALWEWSRFQRAVRHNLSTADVVAVGKQTRWGGNSGLITCGLPHVMPLNQWLYQHWESTAVSLRRQLARQLGSLLGGMHRQGIAHFDCHAGNILIRHESDTLPLWIVDLSPLRFRKPPLGLRERAENVGRLRHSLLHHLRRSDEVAFFTAYWAEMQPDDSRINRQKAMRDLSQRCDALARQCWKQMDRSWARGNRRTIRIELPTVRCRGVADLGRTALEQLCESPLAVLHGSATTVWFAGRTVGVQRSGEAPGWAGRAWEIGHALHRRQIAAPVPVFFLESRGASGNSEFLAVAEELDWRPLTELTSPRIVAEGAKSLQEIGDRVVDLLHRCHDLGFSHDCLTTKSLEYRKNDGCWQVRFASLDFIRQPGAVTSARRRSELQMLAANASRQVTIPRAQWVRWLRRSERLSNSIGGKSAARAFRLAVFPTILSRAA